MFIMGIQNNSCIIFCMADKAEPTIYNKPRIYLGGKESEIYCGDEEEQLRTMKEGLIMELSEFDLTLLQEEAEYVTGGRPYVLYDPFDMTTEYRRSFKRNTLQENESGITLEDGLLKHLKETNYDIASFYTSYLERGLIIPLRKAKRQCAYRGIQSQLTKSNAIWVHECAHDTFRTIFRNFNLDVINSFEEINSYRAELGDNVDQASKELVADCRLSNFFNFFKVKDIDQNGNRIGFIDYTFEDMYPRWQNINNHDIALLVSFLGKEVLAPLGSTHLLNLKFFFGKNYDSKYPPSDSQKRDAINMIARKLISIADNPLREIQKNLDQDLSEFIEKRITDLDIIVKEEREKHLR